MSLLSLWPIDSSGEDKVAAIHSTFLLAIAIKHATAPSITPKVINDYSNTMFAYIESIRKIRPEIDLHPIHHNALHLDSFLHLFGPMHGWWMFPVERLIGTLQRLNINYKPG